MRIVRLFTPLILMLLIVNMALALPGEAKGMDENFKLLGIDKPLEWESWGKAQKWSYLRNLGVYPATPGRYEGEIGPLDTYFSKLGTKEPENWYDMSFEERKAFVEEAKKGLGSEKVSEEKIIPEPEVNNKTKTINPLFIILIISAISICFISFFRPGSKIRKYASYFVYYALPASLLLISIFYTQRDYFRLIGHIAEYILIFILFIKPLSSIFPYQQLRRAVNFRKELGIASFWFFIFHAAGLIYVRNLTSLSYYSVGYLFWGLVAGLGMIILGLTSNILSMKLLKKNWKKLQYLAYPVLFATLAHSSMAQYGHIQKVYLFGGIFILLKIMEFSGVKAVRD